MPQSARVFVGRPVFFFFFTHFLSATAKLFFVVHSKLKRTLANALLLRALSLRRFLRLESVVEFLLLLVVHRVPVV